jgi:hypothetical protein
MNEQEPGATTITRRALLQGTSLMAVGSVCANPAAARKEPTTTPPPGDDWPTYRHDGLLSATSPLKGGLARAPKVAWSLDLGGPKVPAEQIYVGDLDGDGRDEFLTLGQNEIICRDARGGERWKLEGYPRPEVLDLRDYAGDGSRGLLLKTSVGGRTETWMVDGRTGKALSLWQDENNFGGTLRFGSLLTGVRGTQIACTASGETPPAPWGGQIRLVSFERGVSHPTFRVKRFVEGMFYAPLILLTDLNGDGRAELVIISHEEIWSFDTERGETLLQARYSPSIRTYWARIAAVKLSPEDRLPSLVMINPFIPGLKAVRQDGKSSATQLWKTVIGPQEDQYQAQVRIEAGGPDVACDLAGDGRYVVLALITNEEGKEEKRLTFFDAATGKRLAELPDARVLAVEDLDGNGKPEVVLQQGKELQVARWTGTGFQVLWRGECVEPLLRPLPAEGDPTRTAGGARFLWRENQDSPLFLFRFPDGVSACRLGNAGVERVRPILVHEALGNLPVSPGTEWVAWDGKTLITQVDGKEVYRYLPPSPQTYLAPPPLVADLDGKRQILVRDGAGRHLLCSAAGRPGRVLIERSYEKFQGHVDPAGAGPTICDLDGDGRNEVVATLADPAGVPFCAALDGNGTIQRRFDLLPGMQIVNRGPTGSLGAGKGRWLVLRMFYAEGVKPGRLPLVVAYDGKTGERLWSRDYYGPQKTDAAFFAAHLPTAVWDHNSDGADDWLVCSENFYGVLNVKENGDLVGPVNLSNAVPGHWTAYSYPSVANLRGDGQMSVLHHGSYSQVLVTDLEGKPLWHYGMTRDTAGAWG